MVSAVNTQLQAGSQTSTTIRTPETTFWRVEGSLLNLSAVRPVAFFTWNAQTFSERWFRRSGLALTALFRPLLYAADRVFATRFLHMLLRGVSRDRLDLLGEEYFDYVLKPKLKSQGVAQLKDALAHGEKVVLVSQGLDHVMRPLAAYLGVEELIANRLEFCDGRATGRLLSPVIRPRQVLARLIGGNPDGRVALEKLSRSLGNSAETLQNVITPARRIVPSRSTPTVVFDPSKNLDKLSVRESLAGKNVLLIGFTGFIGKVWLAKVLQEVPEIGKVFLLIRRQRSTTAQRRFEKIAAESPVFDGLHKIHGDNFSNFLAEKIEVVEGDVSQSGLGLAPEVHARMQSQLDVIINSSGLTDFNPDLRQALAINIDGTIHVLNFLRECSQGSVLHLSTCYVVGFRDGRIPETLTPNYTPKGISDFDAEIEYESLQKLAKDIEIRAESAEVTEELRRQVLEKGNRANKQLTESEINAQVRKQRQRWVRSELTDAGMQRAQELGWPNTYTFTKSLAESLIATRAGDLPIAVVRPSIVETSTHDPFKGWNEGVNTSAPISYLLGTFFRQLPSNGKKCLDIIPVDLVCRGMALIAAALVERRHDPMYHLATSAVNPCDMRRTIELTGLAHRKHYRAQDDFNYRLLAMFDSISVSKERYQKLSAPAQKQLVQALLRIVSPLPMMRSPLIRRERDLNKVEKLVELYEPFILHNEYVFEARNVELLSLALPPEEQTAFGYDAGCIDWWDYWINIHIPALRKWSYPLIEGRPVENKSSRSVALPAQEQSVAAS
ncbi:MAG TPA: SDR family oxidoreductase [Blastocatellia bacterium]|nr:SDR family oxidoreductase [Blastocatellia bacterium]HMV84352.1 SDR family oxidoreductase [Blastocatellia bacterium]HNG30659.1 SDR family oxidoreductase [Blastocatellia bacterium]